MSETIQDVATGKQMVERATDPVVSPTYATPGDFAAQYATPLNPQEILGMAEEVSAYKTMPVVRTALKQETWREMNVLHFTSGSLYVSFADGSCPEEYEHSGSNTTVTLKTQGVKKSLGISDIMHSQFVAGLPMGGINNILGPVAGFEGLPGVQGLSSSQVQAVQNLKAKEILLGSILLLNEQDKLVVRGNSVANSLEYDGIETYLSTGSACHVPATTTGALTGIGFDRFLAESAVRPTSLWGHSTALQELQAAYYQLGFQASQQIVFTDGNRVVPGYSFASSINTSVGTLSMVADLNFTRTNTGGGTFQSTIYALRMVHNGEPLVYRSVQIPMSYRDLAPGCSAIAFTVWEKSALILKHVCAHSAFPAIFTGRIVTTSPLVGA